jgi:serine/threonine protein phosphatase PrpC
LFEEPIRYHIEPSKHSSKKNGLIKAYAANTHHGLFRNYNEDRVSIILSISKPSSKKIDYWPKCSFFAVYDGHGGSGCADFLRDNLHLFVIWRGNFTNNIFILFLRLKLNKLMKIIREENFPANPEEAIRRGFFNAE